MAPGRVHPKVATTARCSGSMLVDNPMRLYWSLLKNGSHHRLRHDLAVPAIGAALDNGKARAMPIGRRCLPATLLQTLDRSTKPGLVCLAYTITPPLSLDIVPTFPSGPEQFAPCRRAGARGPLGGCAGTFRLAQCPYRAVGDPADFDLTIVNRWISYHGLTVPLSLRSEQVSPPPGLAGPRHSLSGQRVLIRLKEPRGAAAMIRQGDRPRGRSSTLTSTWRSGHRGMSHQLQDPGGLINRTWTTVHRSPDRTPRTPSRVCRTRIRAQAGSEGIELVMWRIMPARSARKSAPYTLLPVPA